MKVNNSNISVRCPLAVPVVFVLPSACIIYKFVVTEIKYILDNVQFCLSLWKIARCSVILLLPLFL